MCLFDCPCVGVSYQLGYYKRVIGMASVKLKPADVFFTSNTAWYARAIAWFTRYPGEKPTYARHVAWMGSRKNVVESWTRVISTPATDWIRKTPRFQVWRCKSLSPQQRWRIAVKIERKIGWSYPWWKIAFHAVDGLAGKVLRRDVRLFRRMIVTPIPICSGLGATEYHDEGITLGVDPLQINPDEFHDYVRKSNQWEKIFEKGEWRIKHETERL